MSAQHAFMKYLGNICNKLLKHSTKEFRSTYVDIIVSMHYSDCLCSVAAQLYAELSQLNLNLPARVCVPLFSSTHQVLRVPTSESAVLNSKNKVSKYILYVKC